MGKKKAISSTRHKKHESTNGTEHMDTEIRSAITSKGVQGAACDSNVAQLNELGADANLGMASLGIDEVILSNAHEHPQGLDTDRTQEEGNRVGEHVRSDAGDNGGVDDDDDERGIYSSTQINNQVANNSANNSVPGDAVWGKARKGSSKSRDEDSSDTVSVISFRSASKKPQKIVSGALSPRSKNALTVAFATAQSTLEDLTVMMSDLIDDDKAMLRTIVANMRGELQLAFPAQMRGDDNNELWAWAIVLDACAQFDVCVRDSLEDAKANIDDLIGIQIQVRTNDFLFAIT
jgi:hypothetical protein